MMNGRGCGVKEISVVVVALSHCETSLSRLISIVRVGGKMFFTTIFSTIFATGFEQFDLQSCARNAGGTHEDTSASEASQSVMLMMCRESFKLKGFFGRVEYIRKVEEVGCGKIRVFICPQVS